jgi:imidazole glycerol-phosphate synthase subunit HisF
MFQPRVIPVLLLSGHGLVKTQKFKSPTYIGDPINAVRIFSEKEADELVLLDIDASREGHAPNYEQVAEIAGECLMPLAYGGGVTSLAQVRNLIRSGVEKVVINSALAKSTVVISESAAVFGSQAIVGAVDFRVGLLGGAKVVTHSGTVNTGLDLIEHVRRLVAAGVGEIFLNSIDRDGMMAGYDLSVISAVASAVDVPVVACGGAGSPQHLKEAIAAGASAAAAGSLFVYHGRKKGVLISYSNLLDQV